MMEKSFNDLPPEAQKHIWSELTLTNRDLAKFNALTKSSKSLREYTLTCAKYTPNFIRNVLANVVAKGATTTLSLLVKNPNVDLSANGNEALKIAAKQNQSESMQILIQNIDIAGVPFIESEQVLKIAAENGFVDILQLLIQHFEPSPAVFSSACSAGYAETAKLLLPYVDLQILQQGLRTAARFGRVYITKLLLSEPRLDPSFNNNEALKIANEHAHPAVITLLSMDSRVYNAITKDQLVNNLKNFVTSPLNMFLPPR